MADAFFRPGGTLPLESRSYIARAADRELISALLEGEYCFILNSRQMGKSSLCVRAVRELEGHGMRVAFLDLTKFGGKNVTPEQWYGSMLAEIGRVIGRRAEVLDYFRSRTESGPMQRFFGAVCEFGLLGGPLRVLVDEIDATRSLPFDADEFFVGIRECFNRRAQDPELNKLAFCLIGVATTTDLIRDPVTTPFNIGRRIELRDFTQSEAMPLADGLGRDGVQRIRRVLYWTGGHPYLTQAVCAEALEHPTEPIDRLIERMFFHAKARETNVNLSDVQNRLLNAIIAGASAEEHRSAVLDRYEQIRSRRPRVPDDETDPVVAQLKLCGLVRVVDRYLWVRNRIYLRVFDRDWIRANMPGAELARQSRAARKAAIRVGLIGAALTSAIGILALTSLSKSLEANARLIERNDALAQARKETSAKTKALKQRDLESTAKSRALALLQDQQAKTRSALIAAQGAAKEAAAQREFAQTKALLASANAHRYLAQKLIAEGKTVEARSNLEQAERLGYVASLQTIQVAANASNWSLIASLLSSPDVAQSKEKGWEFDYWKRQLNLETASLIGHTKVINSGTFSPDGTRFLTASEDGTARIWSVRTGRQLYVLKGHAAAVISAAFSSDGSKIVTASKDKTARIWDGADGHWLRTLSGHKQSLNGAVFSPDGRQVATLSDDKTVKLWNASDGALQSDLVGHSDVVLGAAYLPDAQRLITSSADHTLKIWSAKSGSLIQTLFGHEGEINSFDISADGTKVVSASADKTARIWNLLTGNVIVLQGHELEVNGAAFSPDGQEVATVSFDKTGRIWNANTGRFLAELRGHTGWIQSVTYSPDGKRLVTSSLDGTARTWDATTGAGLLEFKGHAGYLYTALFSPDGDWIGTVSTDGTARIWDAHNDHSATVFKPRDGKLGRAEFSQDGAYVLTVSETSAKVWSVASGKLMSEQTQKGVGAVQAAFAPGALMALIARGNKLRIWNPVSDREGLTIELEAPIKWARFSFDGRKVMAILADGAVRICDAESGHGFSTLQATDRSLVSGAFSKDGSKVLTASSSGEVKLWETAGGKCIGVLRGHNQAITTNLFFAGGTRILTTSYDGRCRIWDTRTCKCLRAFATGSPLSGAALSPNERFLVTFSTGDSSIQLWDVITGVHVSTFSGHTAGVTSARFSPDGRRLVSASMDATARVWDTKTARCLLTLQGHSDVLTRTSFSPDGAQILTSSWDGTAKIWHAK